MRVSLSLSLSMAGLYKASGSSGDWILATGFWVDSGIWDDAALWID